MITDLNGAWRDARLLASCRIEPGWTVAPADPKEREAVIAILDRVAVDDAYHDAMVTYLSMLREEWFAAGGSLRCEAGHQRDGAAGSHKRACCVFRRWARIARPRLVRINGRAYPVHEETDHLFVEGIEGDSGLVTLPSGESIWVRPLTIDGKRVHCFEKFLHQLPAALLEGELTFREAEPPDVPKSQDRPKVERCPDPLAAKAVNH